MVNLMYNQSSRTLTTSDTPPHTLAVMPQKFVDQHGHVLRNRMVLRFHIGEGGVDLDNGTIKGAHLIFQGVARRRQADSLSKILFQYTARKEPLSIDELIAAAESPQQGVGLSVHSDMEVGEDILDTT
mmetsp:Transcript_4173/g.15001  ORF Transcript_4173/g.15001 Transcript_4173/m.15001 type:complete len:128 (+) Transcript_4173:1394-1777(+)